MMPQLSTPSDVAAQSIVTSASDAYDIFTIKKLVSTVTHSSSSTVPPISSSLKNLLSDKRILLQNTINEKLAGTHLPPAFDDVIHVIRHSSFRVGSEQLVMENVGKNADIGMAKNDDNEVDRNANSYWNELEIAQDKNVVLEMWPVAIQIVSGAKSVRTVFGQLVRTAFLRGFGRGGQGPVVKEPSRAWLRPYRRGRSSRMMTLGVGEGLDLDIHTPVKVFEYEG
ncbi:Protein kinase domain-containing protein [Forsythia ovata]|uniref:Protein kinase domain-containing protein n=1 Tax=Forsythia ovata TaxID=205694 RepID=A0ABD1TQ01_9LAMI